MGLSGIKPNCIIILSKKNIICVELVIYLKKNLSGQCTTTPHLFRFLKVHCHLVFKTRTSDN